MQRIVTSFARGRYLAALGAVLAAASLAPAWGQQTSDPAAIAEMLREGGYVLVMRHMSAPVQRPDQAGPGGGGFGARGGGPRGGRGNAAGERQLDETGQAQATAVGFAFRELGITVGEVLRSPTLRAEQTALYLAYDAEPVEQLAPGAANADWLRRRAAQAPEPGTNVLLITHAPNIQSAFGNPAANMTDGETLVIRPENGEARVVGRLTVKDWAVLAVGQES